MKKSQNSQDLIVEQRRLSVIFSIPFNYSRCQLNTTTQNLIKFKLRES